MFISLSVSWRFRSLLKTFGFCSLQASEHRCNLFHRRSCNLSRIFFLKFHLKRLKYEAGFPDFINLVKAAALHHIRPPSPAHSAGKGFRPDLKGDLRLTSLIQPSPGFQHGIIRISPVQMIFSRLWTKLGSFSAHLRSSSHTETRFSPSVRNSSICWNCSCKLICLWNLQAGSPKNSPKSSFQSLDTSGLSYLSGSARTSSWFVSHQPEARFCLFGSGIYQPQTACPCLSSYFSSSMLKQFFIFHPHSVWSEGRIYAIRPFSVISLTTFFLIASVQFQTFVFSIWSFFQSADLFILSADTRPKLFRTFPLRPELFDLNFNPEPFLFDISDHKLRISP